MKDDYLHIFRNYRPHNYKTVFGEYQGKAEYLTHIEIDTRKWLDFAIEHIEDSKVIKRVYVPNKILNIVIAKNE